jgi:hypothetical protein
LHPALADAKPLIVAGGARCGTGFVARTYAAHPEIQMQGEIHPPAMEAAIRFLEETEAIFERMPPRWEHRAAGWRVHRRDLIYAMWGALAKGTVGGPPLRDLARPVQYFGVKTPRHDRYWQFYRSFLGDDVRWVICIRDFVAHYLSNDAMRSQPIEPVARSYRELVDRYHAMRTELGDKVSLFILDDLASGGIEYIRETLFDRLGIPVSEGTLDRIDPERPVNSSQRAQRRLRALTRDERRFLRSNSDLTETIDRLRSLG